MLKPRGVWLFVVLCALCVVALPAGAQCEGRWLPGNGFPGTSFGTVRAAAMWDRDGAGPGAPVLVVGGDFEHAGSALATGLAVWDGEKWERVGPGIGGWVHAILPLANGDLIVGGEIGSAGGVLMKGVARWNGTTWSAMGAGLERVSTIPGVVKCLAQMPNGDIVAGGTFTSSNGQPLNYIARWNGSIWSSLSTGVTGQFLTYEMSVNALAIHNGSLVAAGTFGVIGGRTTNNIARWNGSSWASMNGADGPVNALAIAANGDLIAGGSFDVVGGSVSAVGTARWNGSKWFAVGAGTLWNVWSLATLPNGNIVAGGPEGASNRIAQWNGVVWNEMDGGMVTVYGGTASVNALCVNAAGEVIAAGKFTTAGGQGVSNVASWNGAKWNAIGSGLNGRIQTVFRRSNGDVLASGEFVAIGDARATSLARWTPSEWAPFDVQTFGISGEASAMIDAPNGDLVLGGSLRIDANTTLGGYNIGRWNGSGWVPLAPTSQYSWIGSSNRIAALAYLPNGRLVVGGTFVLQKIGGGVIRNLAQWDGTEWLPVSDVELNSGVNALAVLPNGDLLVGGEFWKAGTVSCNRIARWDGTNWNAMGTGLSKVRSLAVLPNGDVVAGGDFTSAGGNPASNIARWNGTTWAAMGTYAMRPVYSLAVSSTGELIAGGGSSIAGFVARWNGTDWQSLAFHADYKVNSVAFGNHGEILAGGDFRTIYKAAVVPVASAYFARWTDTNVPWVATQPRDVRVESGAEALFSAEAAPGYSEVTYRWQQEDAPGSSVFSDLEDGASPTAPATMFAGVHSASLAISNASSLLSGLSYRVVVSNSCGESSSSASVLAVFCPSDFNNDGLTDDADFTIFVGAYDILDCADPAMASGCVADLNADGLVGDADFSLFLGAYNQMVCP